MHIDVSSKIKKCFFSNHLLLISPISENNQASLFEVTYIFRNFTAKIEVTTMMNRLIDKLHDEHCSLVVLHDGKIHTYSQKGIKDLFYLLEEEPETLYESKVADKVVGKAAAGLLVCGNVTEIYADIISIGMTEVVPYFRCVERTV